MHLLSIPAESLKSKSSAKAFSHSNIILARDQGQADIFALLNRTSQHQLPMLNITASITDDITASITDVEVACKL